MLDDMGWGGGFSTTTINYDTYVDGTLFIDMIDTKKNQLVWQGGAPRRLNLMQVKRKGNRISIMPLSRYS